MLCHRSVLLELMHNGLYAWRLYAPVTDRAFVLTNHGQRRSSNLDWNAPCRATAQHFYEQYIGGIMLIRYIGDIVTLSDVYQCANTSVKFWLLLYWELVRKIMPNLSWFVVQNTLLAPGMNNRIYKVESYFQINASSIPWVRNADRHRTEIAVTTVFDAMLCSYLMQKVHLVV